MAKINLDVDRIISISNELDSLNRTLISSYTPELKDTVAAIRYNVQSTQMNSILSTIVAQIDSITNDISTQLPKLESFLETQMKTYQTTEFEAEYKLEIAHQRMQQLVGIVDTSLYEDMPLVDAYKIASPDTEATNGIPKTKFGNTNLKYEKY